MTEKSNSKTSKNNIKQGSFTNAIEQHIEHFFALHDGKLPESGLHQRVMSAVERILLEKTLYHTNNTHTKAAQVLGINRNTLRKKIKLLAD